MLLGRRQNAEEISALFRAVFRGASFILVRASKHAHHPRGTNLQKVFLPQGISSVQFARLIAIPPAASPPARGAFNSAIPPSPMHRAPPPLPPHKQAAGMRLLVWLTIAVRLCGALSDSPGAAALAAPPSLPPAELPAEVAGAPAQQDNLSWAPDTLEAQPPSPQPEPALPPGPATAPPPSPAPSVPASPPPPPSSPTALLAAPLPALLDATLIEAAAHSSASARVAALLPAGQPLRLVPNQFDDSGEVRGGRRACWACMGLVSLGSPPMQSPY